MASGCSAQQVPLCQHDPFVLTVLKSLSANIHSTRIPSLQSSCAGGSLSQLVLVTGSGIASAKLQLWQDSGIRSISPLDASSVEHLGAA